MARLEQKHERTSTNWLYLNLNVPTASSVPYQFRVLYLVVSIYALDYAKFINIAI